MRLSSTVIAGALAAGATAEKNWLGFNTGSTKPDNSAKLKADFAAEFSAAQKLEGAPGLFNAARLYTNIQGLTTADPIEAFGAAIDTKTHLLLGVWASGVTNIDNEINALKKGFQQYGTDLSDLVIGISIGSEDLYRNSVTGVANKAGVGNNPDALVGFIQDYKKTFAGTPLAKIPVGHVDTWDVWGNATNKPVLDAIDWIGVDEYPYYENGKGNTINNSASLFDSAYDATVSTADGKPVWVTETGWPYVGPNWDEAVPSVANAKYYWDEVGCRKLFNKVPTFWYTLLDGNSANKEEFAITNDLSPKPRFNLTCPTTFATDPDTTTSAGGPSATAKAGKHTTVGTASVSGTSTGSASSSTSTSSSDSDKGSDAPGKVISAALFAVLALAAGMFTVL